MFIDMYKRFDNFVYSHLKKQYSTLCNSAYCCKGIIWKTRPHDVQIYISVYFQGQCTSDGAVHHVQQMEQT